jgi:CheY-like chemotaxis protein
LTGEVSVLIVEDEMLLAMDIEALVEDCGHQVTAQVASLDEFEELPVSLDPQLAFVDVHLKDGSSGLEVCRQATERWPQCLIVFLTANVAKIPPDFCGGHGVIAKPFSQSGMVTAIEFLAHAISDPATVQPRPPALMASPKLERMLHAGQA